MAKHGTRDKLRALGRRMVDTLDDSMKYAQLIDEIADKRSDYINNHLAQIVTLYDYLLDVVKSFISGL